MALTLLLGWAQQALAGINRADFEAIWLEKPVLSNILYNESRLAQLATDLTLSSATLADVRQLNLQEKEAVAQLYQASERIVRNETLAPAQQRAELAALNYNERVGEIAHATWAALRQQLNSQDWSRFLNWALDRWNEDLTKSAVRITPVTDSIYAISYTVFATQYNGYSDWEVAIPDKYIKFANLGWETHAGYEDGPFNVGLERQGLSQQVLVKDVGPWNIDDNYWNKPNDPQKPRRLFTDLPQGKPESQAAYQDGYNGGLDQSGRKVLNPAGCDLTPKVAAALGLAYLENDWIKVTYLWESAPVTPSATVAITTFPESITENQEFSVSVHYSTNLYQLGLKGKLLIDVKDLATNEILTSGVFDNSGNGLQGPENTIDFSLTLSNVVAEQAYFLAYFTYLDGDYNNKLAETDTRSQPSTIIQGPSTFCAMQPNSREHSNGWASLIPVGLCMTIWISRRRRVS
jgi:hypothetical protein